MSSTFDGVDKGSGIWIEIFSMNPIPIKIEAYISAAYSSESMRMVFDVMTSR